MNADPAVTTRVCERRLLPQTPSGWKDLLDSARRAGPTSHLVVDQATCDEIRHSSALDPGPLYTGQLAPVLGVPVVVDEVAAGFIEIRVIAP